MKEEKEGPNSGVSLSDEIKANRKLRRQEKKLAKKSQKEEEFLKNLRKPKDTKIVLADRSLVEKLMNEKLPGGASSDRFGGLSVQDFPELSSSKPFPMQEKISLSYKTVVKTSKNALSEDLFPPITGNKCAPQPGTEQGHPAKDTIRTIPLKQHNTDNEIADLNGKIEKEKKEKKASNQGKTNHADVKQEPGNVPQGLQEVNNEQKRKNLKKKDPIVLKIEELLAVKSQKKDKKHVVRSSRFRRFAGSDVLYGNMLDSSNPKRKRGKQREVKKVTFTKLKLAILRDRIMKLKLRENGTKDSVMDKEQFKIELNKYLSDLSATRNTQNKTEQTVPKPINYRNVIKNEPEPEKTDLTVEKKKKNRTRYRRYCENKYSQELDNAVKALIKGVVYLQDRAHAADPIKARAKQRHVAGLREVKKYLLLKKIKMVILAPDLESQDTVNEVIEELKRIAAQQNIPCVFALSRRCIGYATNKNTAVSAFGILSYNGLEDKFINVKEKLQEARERLQNQQSEPSQPESTPAHSGPSDTAGKQ